MSLTTWEAELLPVITEPGRVRVYLPNLEELIEGWPEVSFMLRRATVRTGCYEPIDVLQMSLAGQVGIWFCAVEGEVVAAFAVEVKQYPRKRVLEMLLCGGTRMKDWIGPAVECIDAQARELGCDHIATCGRAGWARAWGGELTGDVVVVREVIR